MGKKAIYGTIHVINTSESEAVPVTITDNPVEKGAPISDHVQVANKTIEVSGWLLGKNAEKSFRQLMAYEQKGAIRSWKGRIYYKNSLISNLSRTYNTIKNGFEITFTITTIRRAKTSWKRKKKKSSGKKQRSGSKKAMYITVKKGDCYWKWWKRYGTSIAQLRKWNKWPDRRIPIGKRARVK